MSLCNFSWMINLEYLEYWIFWCFETWCCFLTHVSKLIEFICFGNQNSFHEMGFMPYRASLGLFCHLLNSITSGIGRSGRDPLPFLLQGGAVDSRAILIMEFSIMTPKYVLRSNPNIARSSFCTRALGLDRNGHMNFLTRQVLNPCQ